MKLLLFLLTSLSLQAQNLSDTIAFTLNKQSNICVKTRIDNSDTLTLMFHTASSDITLTQEAIKNKIVIKLENAHQVQSWGGVSTSEYSEHHDFFINHSVWKDLTIFVNQNSGADTDGKFGYNLFKNKILQIDYDKKQLIVSEKLPEKLSNYSKMKIEFINESMFIVGSLQIDKEIYKDSFMFHTGYGGAILLDPKLAEKHEIASKLKTISTSELRDSFNNIIKIETKELTALEIGNQQLKNVPLSIAAQSSKIPMKVFGNDLLKRFNVIFDFQKNEMYLKPNSLWEIAYTRKK